MTSKYAIFVTVTLKKGKGASFRPHILKNAEAALRDEPDCHIFHIHVAADEPDRYCFYEVYSSVAALDAHRQTPHFQEYVAATKDMISDRVVQACHLITP